MFPFRKITALAPCSKKSLEARPELAELEPMEDGFDMVFYLDYCPNLEKNEIPEPELPAMQMNL